MAERKSSESRLRANKKYDENHTTKLCLKFNFNTDKDILDKLSAVPSKQGYIKELIRRDLENSH